MKLPFELLKICFGQVGRLWPERCLYFSVNFQHFYSNLLQVLFGFDIGDLFWGLALLNSRFKLFNLGLGGRVGCTIKYLGFDRTFLFF
jgi:hypothetical protein